MYYINIYHGANKHHFPFFGWCARIEIVCNYWDWGYFLFWQTVGSWDENGNGAAAEKYLSKREIKTERKERKEGRRETNSRLLDPYYFVGRNRGPSVLSIRFIFGRFMDYNLVDYNLVYRVPEVSSEFAVIFDQQIE